MARFDVVLTNDLEKAIEGATAWFKDHTCHWTSMRRRQGMRRGKPTAEQLKDAFLSLAEAIKQDGTKNCSSGELYVELREGQMFYGYKVLKTTVVVNLDAARERWV